MRLVRCVGDGYSERESDKSMTGLRGRRRLTEVRGAESTMGTSWVHYAPRCSGRQAVIRAELAAARVPGAAAVARAGENSSVPLNVAEPANCPVAWQAAGWERLLLSTAATIEA